MLFILGMEVLHRLFKVAARDNVLAPLPVQATCHQCCMYADDVMLFITPTQQDLVTTREILNFFGRASGLKANSAKCQAIPIACAPAHIALIQRLLGVPIAEFPIKYLGLPLSVFPLRRSEFQPLIDRVAASMPSWKASLMNKAGWLTTVKAVMTATCVHTIISLKVPDRVFQELDKRHRGFLWAGTDSTTGGQCMVAWPSVCRPQKLGGLMVHDLRIAAYALRLRWFWLQRTDSTRPWHGLDLEFGEDRVVREMFNNSIEVSLGNWHLALFWMDRWLGSASPKSTAPELCKLIKPAIKRSMTNLDKKHQGMPLHHGHKRIHPIMACH
nr:unnamed protein product [Digitaria exilis]